MGNFENFYSCGTDVVTSILNKLGKTFSKRHFEICSYFPQKIGFGVSCKLSPLEIICMKNQSIYQSLFSEKKTKQEKYHNFDVS